MKRTRRALHRARHVLGSVVFLVGTGFGAIARADGASEAQLQFELGSELYKQGRYMEAIDHFVASNRLAPNPNVVLNVARTFAFLKRPLDAYNWYSTYLAFDLPDDQRAIGEAARLALTPEVAVVEVTTTPSGAEIFVDRPELGSQGRSPRKVAVEPGAHVLLLRLPHHHPGEVRVEATRGAMNAAPVALEPEVGTLDVRSTPPGARVIDEATRQELGRAPLTVSIPVGDVRLTLSVPGYLEQTKLVTIAEGRATRLDVRLTREASKVSVLSVTGNVPSAEVLLDGRLVGRAPVTVSELDPGTRRISIRRTGYEPWASNALFEPGAATRVRYSLVDPRDRPWPGYRFIGYGLGAALAVSGAVTGIMAVNANSEFEAEPTREALDRRDSLNVATDVLLVSALVVTGATLIWDLLTPAQRSKAEVTLSR